MNNENIDKLVSQALAIEAESARDAGTIGYMARALVQATMPHRQTSETHFKRTNGNYSLVMVAGDPDIGLPFGSLPRLMLAWIGSEVIKTREQNIVLGNSMSEFMRELGLVPTGGRWGSITRLKDQSHRLFNCLITCTYTDENHFKNSDPFYVGSADLWWNQSKLQDQLGLFQSTVRLSDAFYEEILAHPVPVDLRVLKALKRSPLALDIYSWSQYRIYTLNQSNKPAVTLPWELLQAQFGSSYTRQRDFKHAFLEQLRKISVVCPEARISVDDGGLTLEKSPLQIN